jgi:putative DNA primase/helicase
MQEHDARRVAIARQIWDGAADASGTPVVAYLLGRGISITPPQCLRWAPALRCPDGTVRPAMLARIDARDGAMIGISRTWLVRDAAGNWRRRDRAMLGRAVGGAVRLAPPAETLAVSEGVESGLAVAQATALPVWAGLSTSGLRSLLLPAAVRQVIILGDNDANGAGERAARDAAARWLGEGRQVRLAMPTLPDTDMADVLLGTKDHHVTG